MTYTKCEICGRKISTPNISKHLNSHQNILSKTYKKTNNLIQSLDHEDLYCKYCKNEYKNKNSLVQHEIRCKCNPNKIDTSNSFNNKYRQRPPAWNKGLTKETSSKITQIIETYNKNETLGLHNHIKHYSEEVRLKFKENPKMGGPREGAGYGKSGKYKGIYCDSTYELVFVIYNLDHNINIKRNKKGYEYIYENKKHKYYPDFIMPDGSLVEIKGYYTDVVDIKLAAITDVPIKIYYKKDIQYMFDYVASNYEYKNLYDLYE